ncbi:MAG: hypothetical protein EA370_02940 [Wenzhouxiangella sp.]|nr:MAG: hypothetical protein EA370_02940 [Wenzhouxiangella sp.]
MGRNYSAVAGLVFLLAGTCQDARAEGTDLADWRLEGDIRIGLLANRRDTRNREQIENTHARARLRVRLIGDVGSNWQLRARVAGSYASDQDRFDAYLRRYRPSGTGVVPGDTTLDELHLVYQSDDWQLRVGRFVTGFTLPIVPGKSLDRNDASNFGIGWTDGLHWQGKLTSSWRAHLISQVNSPRGTGNTIRGPIDFSASSSRASLFAAVEATDHPGPFIMRMLGLTWMPASLAVDGIDQPERDDYLTITAKSAAAWPLGDNGLRLVAAGEIGQALNRPQRQAVGLSGDSSVGGSAWQASLNLMDIRPGHHLGAVYGRAQGGWLISNDYRNNDELAELRYQWRPNRDLSVEIRYRWRVELELPAGQEHTRRDQDVYARLTYRF